jgi:glutamate racemase
MKNSKKIGVFDSGLGGLMVAQAMRKRLPQYDYIFLGDTLHVPYGSRSDEVIYTLSENAMRYLFAQGCDLVVIACNTVSATALRKLQQQFLVNEFPQNRILGVVVPTLEKAIELGSHRIGLLATQRTVLSKIYEIELNKLNESVSLEAVSARLLVPLIENQGDKYMDAVLTDYVEPLRAANVESIILGCTHYIAVKDCVRSMTDGKVHVISQDEIIPDKFADYLVRHPEYAKNLSQGGTFEIHATDVNETFAENVNKITGQEFDLVTARY